MQKVSDYILKDLRDQLKISNGILKQIQALDDKKGVATKELSKFIKKNDKLTKLIDDNYAL